MIKPGLVSITFRNLSVQEISGLAAKSGLVGIEWGGDVHVPHGDVGAARKVRKLTVDAGWKWRRMVLTTAATTISPSAMS